MHDVAEAHTLAAWLDERRRVLLALDARFMAAFLRRAFFVRGAGDHGKAASCHVLSAKYEPGQYCSVVYQLGTQTVTGLMNWQDTARLMPATAYLISEVGMWVFRIEDDPALPGLRVATDGRAMAAVLSEAMPECRDKRHSIVRCNATPVRYRPQERCTVRLDVWLRDARSGAFLRRTLFAKVYDNLREISASCNAVQALFSSTAAWDHRLSLAPLIAVRTDLRLVVLDAAEGVLLESHLSRWGRSAIGGGSRGWKGVVHSAGALAALHSADAGIDRHRSIDDELASFVQRAARVASVESAIGLPLIRLAEALPAWSDRLGDWGAETRLTHGDCKPNQVLINGERVVILDLDACGMADPALDVGTYLATLRQLGIKLTLDAVDSGIARARRAWFGALESRFLDEYCAVAGREEDFRRRAAWYEAVALMRKALRAFSRSPRSRMPAAEVEEGWRCLETLPRAGGLSGGPFR